MSGFLYGLWLQWRLDMRSKTMLVACYFVPLVFFAVMGTVFTSVFPDGARTLLPSLTVFSVSMGALIGVPPSVSEIYGGNIKNLYRLNGAPFSVGLLWADLSAFMHLLILTVILYLLAPAIFGAELPERPALYFGAAAFLIAASLSLGSAVGLLIKNPANTAGVAIALFLPSVMLSGIMFPAQMLPKGMMEVGKMFPASWGYALMLSDSWKAEETVPLALILAVGAGLCAGLLLWVKKRI